MKVYLPACLIRWNHESWGCSVLIIVFGAIALRWASVLMWLTMYSGLLIPKLISPRANFSTFFIMQTFNKNHHTYIVNSSCFAKPSLCHTGSLFVQAEHRFLMILYVSQGKGGQGGPKIAQVYGQLKLSAPFSQEAMEMNGWNRCG